MMASYVAKDTIKSVQVGLVVTPKTSDEIDELVVALESTSRSHAIREAISMAHDLVIRNVVPRAIVPRSIGLGDMDDRVPHSQVVHSISQIARIALKHMPLEGQKAFAKELRGLS